MMSLGKQRLLWWVLALLLASAFAWMGRWQLARMHEKQAMLQQATQALDQAHPRSLLLASDTARTRDYDWAAGVGSVLDVALWLDNQQHAGQVGVRLYCVMLPDDGVQALLVDVGWWPLNGRRELPAFDCPAGVRRAVRGLLAPAPSEGLLHGAPIAAAGNARWLLARMDRQAIALALHLKAGVAPRVLRLDPARQSGDAGVMLVPGQRDLDILPNTMPPERHLGYAVQWFGLALCVLVVALVMTLRTKKRA